MIADRHWTYGDVIFCELVVEVVYTDFASVAGTKSAVVRLRVLRSRSLLVRCAPRRSPSVVGVFVFVSTAATARAVFFVAIVYPVADSELARSPPSLLHDHVFTHRCHFFRRVCSISPEVGVSFVFVCSSPPPLVDIARL